MWIVETARLGATRDLAGIIDHLLFRKKRLAQSVVSLTSLILSSKETL